MNLRSYFTPVWFWALTIGLFAGNASAVLAGEAKFEAQLVWATNDEPAPGDNHKPVDEETQKKLDSLECLKWKHFYLVNKQDFEVAKGESEKVVMSDKCSIQVKHLDGKRVEFILFGKKGEECSKRVQSLTKGETMVHGGKVEGKTSAWLITLKRVK